MAFNIALKFDLQTRLQATLEIQLFRDGRKVPFLETPPVCFRLSMYDRFRPP